MTRTIHWEREYVSAKRKAIDDTFGDEQLYLVELATHPDYQLRGSGTRLVGERIAFGRREKVNVTLLAQVTAETFYLRLGFVEVGNVSVVTADGDEVRFPVMKYEYWNEGRAAFEGEGENLEL
ncbi:hypothetical protein BU23DRAFT_534621 [Bimuria novae-zelandiae CBS 107.79]|uniref:N-acetyltransferase domain-containing protein n=1 Tax=Bimuria novae-zelandiae CBS 107.79 TaxID=1447943 RepID=A0A6A5V5P2_9PLEO|nr:hypothetical protein BU23DRAFT_534621 [Bimuria novae-zelandiae CBS 107.79]